MAYKAALTQSFLKEFKKLPDRVKERISRAINEVITNPLLGVKLRGELEGRWRWRVGKYGIIYLINQEQRLIVLLDVGPRKTVYE